MDKEPILIINFEINKPYRPQMIVYEDSNIDELVNHFVKTHQLKATAVKIIKDILEKNLESIRKESKRFRQKQHYTRWKQKTRQSNSKENKRLYNKQSLINGSSEKYKNKKLASKQINYSKQTVLNEVQKQFQRQFRNIKINRIIKSLETQLQQIFSLLIVNNPDGSIFINPDYIDFSVFDDNILNSLEIFFSRLDQSDFKQLNFQKFKQLLEKYSCYDFFQNLKS